MKREKEREMHFKMPSVKVSSNRKTMSRTKLSRWIKTVKVTKVEDQLAKCL